MPPALDARPTRSPTAGRLRSTIAIVGVVLAAVVGVSSTLAAWTDNATATAGPFTTGKVTSQAAPSCSTVFLSNNVRLTWTQVNSRYDYAWELRNASTNALVTSGTVGGGTAAGANVTLDITPTQAGSNAVFNVTVRARLTATSWVSPTVTTTPIRRATVIVTGMYCGAA